MMEEDKKNGWVKDKNKILLNEENKENNKNVGFWKRVIAVFLDWVPLMLVLWLLYVLYENSYNEYLAKNNNDIVIHVSIVELFLYLFSFGTIIYNICLYYKYGQGIGYKILGFKIVDENTKERPEKVKLLKRWMIKEFPIIILLFFSFAFVLGLNLMGVITYMLLYFFVLFWFFTIALSIGLTKNKRGLHDKWSKTIVIQENIKK